MNEYNLLIETAKKDANKILSESRQKLNDDMQIKRAKIQKEIDEELEDNYILCCQSYPTSDLLEIDIE